MTKRSFAKLPTKVQVEVVKAFGLKLMEIPRCTYTMVLYSFHKLYVEVIVNKKTKNILCVNAFDDSSCLDPYLESIDISSLFTAG